MSSISILPLDVGFDLRHTRHPVCLTDDVTSVQHLDADGNPAVTGGTRANIVAALVAAGYVVKTDTKK